MKVSEENFDESRETSAFVDDGLVRLLEISYLLFPLGKLIDCDGFYVKQYHVRFVR